MTIQSTLNEKNKRLTKILTKNSERKKQGVFIRWRNKENLRALQFCLSLLSFSSVKKFSKLNFLLRAKTNFVSKEVYEKIAYEVLEGVIGIYKEKNKSWKPFLPKKIPPILYSEGIEKPGNLGANFTKLRSFGIDALIITDTKVDFYNPNVIRSSVWDTFRNEYFSVTNEEVLEFLTRTKFKHLPHWWVLRLKISAKKILLKNLQSFSAQNIQGLSDFLERKRESVLVPMCGTIDSLNLSNAVAITYTKY